MTLAEEDVVQLVEYLPNMQEALGSRPTLVLARHGGTLISALG